MYRYMNYIIGLTLILSVLTFSSVADEYEEKLGDQIRGTSDTSTGGRGVVTCEPATNVEKVERYKQNMIKDSVNMYPIADPEFGIYFVAFIGQEDENDVAMRAEFLNTSSKCKNVTQDIPGIIYKNINVWLGSPTIKDAIIRSRVENSWLKDNSISVQNVSVFRWNKQERKWNILETQIIHRDDTYTYFESKANGLSQFVISGLVPEVAAEIINNPEWKETPIASEIESVRMTKTITGIFITLIIGIMVAYLILKKKK